MSLEGALGDALRAATQLPPPILDEASPPDVDELEAPVGDPSKAAPSAREALDRMRQEALTALLPMARDLLALVERGGDGWSFEKLTEVRIYLERLLKLSASQANK